MQYIYFIAHLKVYKTRGENLLDFHTEAIKKNDDLRLCYMPSLGVSIECSLVPI